ncbi:hypothetical protein L204_103505 [Cryptococcus depauperatus]
MVSHHGSQIHSVKLGNGEHVSTNDHVYVYFPWSARDGMPYTIARVIEFMPLQTKDLPTASSCRTAARLSLYYRPMEVSARNISDVRLLLAAIHTDIQPINIIKGKCYVRHRDRIEDLLEWKRRPDHFYFVKFFDPYIKREFEMIRTAAVNNIPHNVKKVLMRRYEYLITEKEMVTVLIDDLRSCCKCHHWASFLNSVRCELCKENYHMNCLHPPLVSKPAKGYFWVCPPCSLHRNKNCDTGKSTPVRPTPNLLEPKAPKIGDMTMSVDARPDVMFRGWPWRYFGLYTNAEDSLDPEDSIFPRAVTRVGVKFQANVPSWQSESMAEDRSGLQSEAALFQSNSLWERGHSPAEDESKKTIQRLSTPTDDLAEYMEDVKALDLAVPPWNVERLNLSIHCYMTMGRELAYQHMSSTTITSFKPINLNDEELDIFEAELERNGGLNVLSCSKLINRPSSEILRFFHIWKNDKLKSQNEVLVQASHSNSGVNGGHSNHKPQLSRSNGRENRDQSHTDDRNTGCEEISTEFHKMACVACGLQVGDNWLKCPRTFPGVAMCQFCGLYYRKYGVITSTKPQFKGIEQKEVRAKKTRKNKDILTPVDLNLNDKSISCACCGNIEPGSDLARCTNCTFAVHTFCYGLDPQFEKSSWKCDLCANLKLEDCNLQPRCVLCPQRTCLPSHKQKAVLENDLLTALKRTEGRHWAHLLCSTWTENVTIGDSTSLNAMEGIMTIPQERWAKECNLCHQHDGAVLSCTDCDNVFHPSCAWLSGYRFFFNLVPAELGKSQATTIIKFKESEGIMTPGIWCKNHHVQGRKLYGIYEMDSQLNQTAFQVYISHYKSASAHLAFPLLRKARRLEAHVPPSVQTKIRSTGGASERCIDRRTVPPHGH